MEANTGEVRMEKAKKEKSKGGSRKKMREKGEEKEAEKRKNDRGQESSRGVRDLG